MPAPRFLRETDAAAYLDLAPKTIARWRRAGAGPTFHRFGSAVRYAVADLDAFISRTGVAP